MIRSVSFANVSVAGLGYALPPEQWTSQAVEEMLHPLYARLGLPTGRLEMMSGVEQRGVWPVGTAPSAIAVDAAEHAMREADLGPASLDTLIYAGVSKDFLEPATAAVVHHAIGASADCGFFDVQNACLGILNGMLVLAAMIEAGHVRTGLVVAGENGRPLLEATIRRLNDDPQVSRKSVKQDFASLTIGSAGAAVLLCHASLRPSAPRLLGAVSATDSTAHQLCRGVGSVGGADGVGRLATARMWTDAEALLGSGVALARTAWNSLKAQPWLATSAVTRAHMHQVGRAHDQVLCSALGVEAIRSEPTYPWLGNTGSAALPLTWARDWASEPMSTGQQQVLLGIGSGLSTIMMGVGC